MVSTVLTSRFGNHFQQGLQFHGWCLSGDHPESSPLSVLFCSVFMEVVRSSRSGDLHLYSSVLYRIHTHTLIHTLSTVYSCILMYTLCNLLTSNPPGSFCQRFTSFLQSHGGRKLNHSTCSFTDPTSESPTESNHQSGLLRSIY